MTNTVLSYSELTGAAFDDVSASGAQFVGSDLTNAYFFGANLTDTDFDSANLTDTDFTDANLTGAALPEDLTTVIWENTTCPDGTNSNAHGDTCVNNLNQ